MNKEVLKGNRLIAEFMGWTQQLDIEERWYGAWFDQHGVRKAWPKGHEPLLFNESWDWLMPVLAKIGKDTGHELVIHSETSHWNQFGDNALIFDFLGYEYPLQDGIWKAVVEFIKWYNENNKTNDYAGINY